MTSAIAPGDFVECIESWNGPPGLSVVRGQIYCIATTDLGVGACPDCGPFPEIVTFKELPEDKGGWCLCLFRPIHRPSASKLMDVLKENVLSPREKGEIDADVFTDGLTR